MFKKERFSIEPFRHRVDLEPDYKEKTWKKLDTAMFAIFNHNPSKLSFEELYRCAYNMVLHKFGSYLYQNVRETISRHLEQVGKEVESRSGEAFLQVLVTSWSDYTRSMQNIRDILMYMNKTFVKQHNRMPVHELGLQLWNKHLLERPLVQSMLKRVVLEAVLKFRRGDRQENKLISQVTKMCMDIGVDVYRKLIEDPIQEDTEAFYRGVSQTAIRENDCSSYLNLVKKSLEEEAQVVALYLFEVSKLKVVSRVEQEMIGRQVETLITMEGSGLLHQLTHRKHHDLELMYSVLKRSPNGHPAMIERLKEHLLETGTKIINSNRDKKKTMNVTAIDSINHLVDQLIAKRGMYDEIISRSFHSDKAFGNAIQWCFEKVLNSNPATPEYLSIFLDTNLRKNLKGKTDEEAEAVIDRVMTLFRYLYEKDVFEKYYKQLLAKRLLSGMRPSSLEEEEHEKIVILKLKTECGYQFTSKLESMFNDIRTSQDIMQSFGGAGGGGTNNNGGDIDMSVQVLTMGSWPTQQNAVQCETIPSELQACCSQFEEFYLKTHSGRKLSWQTNMGQGEVRCHFRESGKTHVLMMSTVQMCVLMLFREADRLSYAEVRKAVGENFPEGELKRTLQSLACVKGKNVLNKVPSGREVEESDAFCFNEGFKSSKYKVKIHSVLAVAGKGGGGDGSGSDQSMMRLKVDEDRKPQIEAAIVRVMKSRRVLGHNLLVGEVTKMLNKRFVPEMGMIKQRIESLIEREFLERDAEDRRKYRYIV
jgi:cullin 3